MYQFFPHKNIYSKPFHAINLNQLQTFSNISPRIDHMGAPRSRFARTQHDNIGLKVLLKGFSHRKLIFDMLFPLKSYAKKPLQYGEIPFQY